MRTIKEGGLAGEVTAWSAMTVSVMGFALFPLVVSVGGGEDSPFLVNALLRMGLALGYMCWMTALCPGLVGSFGFWKDFANELRLSVWPARSYRWWRLAILGALLGNFDSAFFSAGLRYVDVSVVVIATEMSPVAYTLIREHLARVDQGGSEVKPVKGWTLLGACLGVGGAGVALVLLAQGGDGLGTSLWKSATGVGLLVCAVSALLSGCPAFSLMWGLRFAESIADEGSVNPLRKRLVCVAGAMMCCNIASLPVGIGYGLWSGEVWPVGNTWGLWLSVGIVASSLVSNSIPAVMHVWANLLTRNSGVNLLGFAGPAVSVVLLYWLWEVGVEQWGLFWLGTALVVVANVAVSGMLDLGKVLPKSMKRRQG